MEKKESELVLCAKGLLDLVLDATGHELVYRELIEREPLLRKIPLEGFAAEYVPAKLALGCVSWVGCCAAQRIEDKDLQNLFFKEVMALFQSPKSLENATRFSESLYASNADKEQSPVLAVMIHLFHKFGLSAIVPMEDSEELHLSEGFRFMMEVSEAMKNVFEAQFEEFYYAHPELFLKAAVPGKKV